MTCPIHSTHGYGCRHCDLAARRASQERRYTRAEVLAFGERVKRKCAEILERKRDSDDRRYGGNDPAFNAMTDASEVVRAVDVARLLEDKETHNE